MRRRVSDDIEAACEVRYPLGIAGRFPDGRREFCPGIFLRRIIRIVKLCDSDAVQRIVRDFASRQAQAKCMSSPKEAALL